MIKLWNRKAAKIRLVKKEKCTGCAACYNICPVGAIKMVEDSEGFFTPLIDEQVCIKCGLCLKVCPEINKFPIKGEVPLAYAAWNLDQAERANSSSGGIFSVFANFILEQKGVVFAAEFDQEMGVRHALFEKKEDLPRFRGSKYLQSKIGFSFKEIKGYLEKGKKVLFSGTPCQVAGLRAFLGKDYDNLLTCDLVCHGVCSPRVFKDYLRSLERKYGAKVVSVFFRDKSSGWQKYRIKIVFENGKEYSGLFTKERFFTGFIRNIYLRPSCAMCRYAKIPRVGDITLGDFWGIGGKERFPYNSFEGVSLVLINNEKGRGLFNSCQDRYFAVKRELREAVSGNLHLRVPMRPSRDRKGFFLIFNSKGFDCAAEKYLQ